MKHLNIYQKLYFVCMILLVFTLPALYVISMLFGVFIGSFPNLDMLVQVYLMFTPVFIVGIIIFRIKGNKEDKYLNNTEVKVKSKFSDLSLGLSIAILVFLVLIVLFAYGIGHISMG